MSVRERACDWMSRYEVGIMGLGFSGMLGFVVSCASLVGDRLGLGLYFVCVALSLLLLGASFLIGYLGDPYELRKRQSQLQPSPPRPPTNIIPFPLA